MYSPDAFREDDPRELCRMIRAFPLATLLVNGADGPVAAYLPFAIECGDDGGPSVLIGHLARANPAWQVLADQGSALAIFGGPDAYVSPSLYPSKAEHGRVVPTWNYERVEVRGRVTVETDAKLMLDYVRRPTDAQESSRPLPWSVEDAPTDFIAKLGHALVGVRLEVTEASGKRKLSQDRKAADYQGVLKGLSFSADPADRALAQAMTHTRSQSTQ